MPPRCRRSTLQTHIDLPQRCSRPWCAHSEGWAHRQLRLSSASDSPVVLGFATEDAAPKPRRVLLNGLSLPDTTLLDQLPQPPYFHFGPPFGLMDIEMEVVMVAAPSVPNRNGSAIHLHPARTCTLQPRHRRQTTASLQTHTDPHRCSSPWCAHSGDWAHRQWHLSSATDSPAFMKLEAARSSLAVPFPSININQK